MTQGSGSAKRMAELMGDADLGARTLDTLDVAPEPKIVTVTCGQLDTGLRQ